MRFVERPEPDIQSDSDQESFGEYVRTLVRSRGHTIEGFRQKYRIALQANITQKQDITREKFAEVLQVLEIPEAEQEIHWSEYTGEFPLTLKGIVMAGIRRYGLEELEKSSGISRATIYSVAHGEQHKNRTPRERYYPPLSTWLAIASAVNIGEREAEQIWDIEMRKHFIEEEKMTELGAEMEMVFRSSDVSINKWRKEKYRPKAFKKYSSRSVTALLQDFRKGVICSWEDTKKFLQGVMVSDDRYGRVAKAWLIEVMRQKQLTDEMLTEGKDLSALTGAVNNNDWLQQARAVHAELNDRENFQNIIEALAEEGDTIFKPGSLERQEIFAYRLKHGLPIHHPKDIKCENVSGIEIKSTKSLSRLEQLQQAFR